MARARLTQYALEVLVQAASTRALITQDLVEVLAALPTASPTTVTGAGVTQDVVEVLMAPATMARVTTDLIEVLMADESGDDQFTTLFGALS